MDQLLLGPQPAGTAVADQTAAADSLSAAGCGRRCRGRVLSSAGVFVDVGDDDDREVHLLSAGISPARASATKFHRNTLV